MIRVYTDGSYMPSKEVYSIGVVIIYSNGFTRTLSEYYKQKPGICSNYAEITAVLEAFRSLVKTEPIVGPVTLTTDSMYVVNALKRQESKKYPEELKEVLELAKSFQSLTVRWTKGHKGHPHNELCDVLSTLAIRLFEVKNNLDKENEDGVEKFTVGTDSNVSSILCRAESRDLEAGDSNSDSEGTSSYSKEDNFLGESDGRCYDYCEYCERNSLQSNSQRIPDGWDSEGRYFSETQEEETKQL